MKYKITLYRNGKPRVYRFPDLPAASAAASDLHRRTGIVAGIEAI